MIALPPNFKYIHTISFTPIPWEPYELLLYIRDKNGEIIEKYKYKNIPNTSVHYTEFTTPSEEGVYILEVWYIILFDSHRYRIYEDYLIVSKTKSLIGALQSAYEELENLHEGVLKLVKDRMRILLDTTNNILIPRAKRISRKCKELREYVDNHILPTANETKQGVDTIKFKIEEQIIPEHGGLKAKLEKLLKWFKKRNA